MMENGYSDTTPGLSHQNSDEDGCGGDGVGGSVDVGSGVRGVRGVHHGHRLSPDRLARLFTGHAKSSRTKKKEVEMTDRPQASSSKMSNSNWRRKLPVTPKSPEEAEDGAPCVCTGFKRSSSMGSHLADSEPSPQALVPVSPHQAARLAPYRRTQTSGGRPPVVSLGWQPQQTPRLLPRNSPFCPCFSPNDSDDDGNREQLEPRRRVPGGAHRQLLTMARELRVRFAIVADANNQTPVTIEAPGVMVAQPYPVHTQIEYTHYLVPVLAEISSAPYYWGVMDRFEAEKLLEGKVEGTFLLRDSAQTEYLFSVSFRRYQRTLHARVEQFNHKFSFDCYDPGVFSAPKVTQLIEHYKDPAKCLFFEPQLSSPLNRNFVFSLQHLSRAAVADRLGYDDIQALPVPRKIKDYLREYHYKLAVRVKNLEK